jgi:Fe-S cluster assembly ATP-binding protein
MQFLLDISHLGVTVAEKTVLHDFSLQVPAGEIHAIMGPNGSGKSTLVSSLMGSPKYQVTGGQVTFNGQDLLALSADARARAGLFLAFQYPKEIAGVTLRSFLYAAYTSQIPGRFPDEKKLTPIKFKTYLMEQMQALHMDPAFMERSMNQGFSGGEKKKAEVLQMAILRPKMALLDETDSGLDVDALKIVAGGVNRLRSPQFSAVVVTHYARILHELRPDKVHIMVQGRIRETGGMELAERLEQEGYARYGVFEQTEDKKIKLDVS